MKVIQLGLAEYSPIFHAMEAFTDTRSERTEDELWVVEHPPVFTQGMAGKAEHLLARSNIPVVQIDRGGQITYHGPGQLVVYTLIDFKRRKISVRELVSRLENSIIATLAEYGIAAAAYYTAHDYIRNGAVADSASVDRYGVGGGFFIRSASAADDIIVSI